MHTIDLSGRRLRRHYVDVYGIYRHATYVDIGPAGVRWLMDDRSILTIDLVLTCAKVTWDPWTNAREVRDEWITDVSSGS